MSASEPVKLVKVEGDLKIVAKTQAGAQLTVTLAGLSPPADAAAAREELERLLTGARALRIVREGERAFVEYLAAQDRSGAVWFDAGRVLVSSGLALAGSEPFSRQTEYQQTQQQAAAGVTPRYPFG